MRVRRSMQAADTPAFCSGVGSRGVCIILLNMASPVASAIPLNGGSPHRAYQRTPPKDHISTDELYEWYVLAPRRRLVPFDWPLKSGNTSGAQYSRVPQKVLRKVSSCLTTLERPKSDSLTVKGSRSEMRMLSGLMSRWVIFARWR